MIFFGRRSRRWVNFNKTKRTDLMFEALKFMDKTNAKI